MKIHFIGIGGIGTSALAQYYLAKGAKVSGSDLVSSEITDFLKNKGIKISIGHKKEHIKKDLDLVIYSPAVNKNNPELKQAKKLGIKCLSYPEALGELTKEHFTIAVCGTHGKSTTTAMISLILIKAGLNPTVILGTKLKEFGNSNFRMGGKPKDINYQLSIINDQFLVIEADEWNASFLNYWPKIIVLTNIEKEHLDYYKNLRNLLRAFKEFIGHLPKDGVLIANRDDKNIRRILNSKSQALNSKQIPNPKSQIPNINFYSMRRKEAEKLKKTLKVPGKHNVYNALAALTVARVLGIPDKISYEMLSKYKGAWRRLETHKTVINNKPAIIISDYAHHPTEIFVTIKAIQEQYPDKPIWLVFQPHQYQRTYYLFKDFVKVLTKLDLEKIIIPPIYEVAGREMKNLKIAVSSQKLVEVINKSSKQNKAIFIKNFEGIKKYLLSNFPRGIIVIMGAGDIYELSEQF
jgi:UDP-N-acetylmuramate--alanine ligase